MRRSPKSALCPPRPALRWSLALALCVLAASCLPVHSQTTSPAPPALQAPSAAFPTAPSFTAPAGGISSTGATVGLNLGRPSAAGPGQSSPFALSPFGASPAGTRQTTPAPLFSIGSGLTRGPAISPNAPYGSAPAPLPSLTQLMRGSSLALPLNSTPGSFNLTFQNTFTPGASSGDLPRPPGSIVFGTADLGNGISFSAGTGYGSRSLAGAPAVPLGNGALGAPRRSGTALNLKLSF